MERELKDRIIKDAFAQVETYRARGYGVVDYSAAVKQHLMEREEVEEVLRYGQSDLTVRFRDKTQVGILLGREAAYGGALPNTLQAPTAPRSVLTDPPYPGSAKAGVLDPLYDDWPPQSTPDGIVIILQGRGYDVELVTGDAVDLDFFTTLDQKGYGVVFLRTHGGVMDVGGDPKLHIMTRPFYDSYPPDSGYDGVGVFYVWTNWGSKYAYAFNDEFVEAYMNDMAFPDTLIHLLVCYGAAVDAQDDMIPAFLNRGVGCYTGWTLSASSTHGDPAAVMFFDEMAGGASVAEAIVAIQAAGHSPDPSTGAVLVAHGDDGMHLGPPDIELSVVELDFGEVSMLTRRAAERNFVVRNVGHGPLSVSNLTSDRMAFTVVGATSFSIAPAGSHEMTINYTPSAEGEQRGTIQISSNDPDEPTVSLSVVGRGKRCFVATAAYGSSLAGEIEVLRYLRDNYLLGHRVGEVFVSLYYRYGPSLADFIGKCEPLRRVVRLALRPVVFAGRFLKGK